MARRLTDDARDASAPFPFTDRPMTRFAVHALDFIDALQAALPILRPKLALGIDAGEHYPPPVPVGTETDGLRDLAYPFSPMTAPFDARTQIELLRTKAPALRAYVSDDGGATWRSLPADPKNRDRRDR